LKKRNKKLLLLAGGSDATRLARRQRAIFKSFLVLFFKKELLLAFLICVTAIRLYVAATMPLSADEAYYRIWAHALAPGYLDHPPMVALWIWIGTAIAGDTPLGIRLLSPLAVLLGSFLLVRAGEDLQPGAGRRSVWYFNATLLLNAGAVTATPDTPLLLFWTACVAALARLVRTGQGAWWLAAGAAGGLAFDSKYTAALLGPCVLVWLVMVPDMRPWLRRWQPYAAAALAVLLTAPVLAWNAAHGWASFARQGGRAGDWHPAAALRHLAELLGGQVGLTTPVLFGVFVAGLVWVVRGGRWRQPGAGLVAAMIFLPVVVFLQHALGDRVQANWPAVVYPGLALAAGMMPVPVWLSALGVGVGLAMSGLVMLQAAAAPLRLPRKVDFSLIRLAGWDELARAADAARGSAGADCVAADEYGLAAELAYRLKSPVLGAEPRWTYFNLPAAPRSCGTVLMVRRARHGPPAPDPAWRGAALVGGADRGRGGIVAEHYTFYRLTTPPGAVLLPSG
jgi:4-amino-4-deoxy-L-arabinose transferase-like glycosyltransferase